jgi:hypothetical protein
MPVAAALLQSLSVSLCLFLLLSGHAHAGWVVDGIAVCSAPNDQDSPTMIPDGSGGGIVAWYDDRNGLDDDIYAQRVDGSGTPQWTTHGVALCTAPDDQLVQRMCADGAGGAIVAWHDYRSGSNYDIYAQRVDASGTPLWATDGIALCAAAGDQVAESIIADGTGGAIIAWSDTRSGGYDIYAQRVDASGAPLWMADGVAVCTDGSDQTEPDVAPDGAGGAIVAWSDGRNPDADVYAQRVDASGTPLWTTDGVAICTETGDQGATRIVADGAGGAVIVWADDRGGIDYDLYAQRVDDAGTPLWTTDGVPVCTAASDQHLSKAIPDGAGGMFVSWYDSRGGSDYGVYVQWVDESGVPQWTHDGIAPAILGGNKLIPGILRDGEGGLYVAWNDDRGGDSDIYAQRLDASGVPRWTVGGVVVSGAMGHQRGSAIVPDASGGLLIAWRDERHGTRDIYAQRLEPMYGAWGRPAPTLDSVADIPNDQGGVVALNWAASGRDVPLPATIDYYSIWRAVDEAPGAPFAGGTAARAMPAPPAPAVAMSLPSIEQVRPGSPPGTLLLEPPFYWELVGTQTAQRWEHYSFAAATRADSVDGDPGETHFMVAAHSVDDEHVAFSSNALSGHSVDNLAPGAPFSLTAERQGPDVVLAWGGVVAGDLRDYALYRSTMGGVTPVPGNFLLSAADTVAVDTNAPGTMLHYIVTAFDVHENQSLPSNEVSVSEASGIGDVPAPITRLTVLQNRPNPFAASTELAIGLPADSDLALEVYDVTGRQVDALRVAGAAAGWNRITIDARDRTGRELPAGVYFYRVEADGIALTRKMIVCRGMR